MTRGHTAILLLVAAVGLAAHLLTAGNYGIFRDELYYLDCAQHLDWGYVDHPPLAMGLLRVSVTLLGDSQVAIRILPAVAGALLVIITGLLAIRFGGDRFSIFLASLAALVVPVYLINTGFYSMNCFELLFWALAFLVLAHILAGGSWRLWLLFGVVMGLAMMNKVGIAALAAGLLPALVLTGQTHHLKNRHFWMGAALSALIVAPHILWQIVHAWPTAEFVHNATAGKIVALSLVEYFTEQIMMMNPMLFPLWLLGLGLLLFWPRLRPYRALGLIWLVAFLFFGLQKGKAYYLSSAYPPLLAAGACGLGHWLSTRLHWMRAVLVAVLVAGGAIVAPLSFPILSPDRLVAFMDKIGIHPKAGETTEQAVLPQHFADRFGWENMAATVAEAYHDLDDSLRTRCAIVTRNYGEAGALNYYRKTFDLPRTYCQHNNYFLWGTEDATGEVLLAVNYSVEELQETYRSVVQVGTVVSEWAMPYETDVPICICTGLKRSWHDLWQDGRFYY